MSRLVEINFDGIIGPSHNYAGLSRGNIASATHAGATSYPRKAALQGIAKMRANMDLGLVQGFFLPHPRPDHNWLGQLATTYYDAPPHLQAQSISASAMWAANAATVSPAPDTADHRCHLSVANLQTMPHRSHEWPYTLRQLQLAFADDSFAVHGPVLPPFGDEGAANHMRLCNHHGDTGLEVFVYGRSGGNFPARQHEEASRNIARRHGLNLDHTLFLEQSPLAISKGAFHNDVVAVANENVLFTHEQAFANRDAAHAAITDRMDANIIEVPADAVSLEEAIASYLFNAQLVTLPDEGGMALIVPTEARDTPAVWQWLEMHVSGNSPIRRLIPVDVRQSMANGGGPACLRLRVVTDPDKVDPRFIATHEALDRIENIIAAHWPETLAPEQLTDKLTVAYIGQARGILLAALGLEDLV